VYAERPIFESIRLQTKGTEFIGHVEINFHGVEILLLPIPCGESCCR
jgi:hypothetical protein